MAHPDLAKGIGLGSRSKETVDKMWDDLASKLNSHGRGASKTGVRWKRYWADLKCKVKNRAARRRQEVSGTGGGPPTLDDLSEIDKKVLAIIGEGAVYGDIQHRVPAFNPPSTSTQSDTCYQSSPAMEIEILTTVSPPHYALRGSPSPIPPPSSPPPLPLALAPQLQVNSPSTRGQTCRVLTTPAPRGSPVRHSGMLSTSSFNVTTRGSPEHHSRMPSTSSFTVTTPAPRGSPVRHSRMAATSSFNVTSRAAPGNTRRPIPSTSSQRVTAPAPVSPLRAIPPQSPHVSPLSSRRRLINRTEATTNRTRQRVSPAWVVELERRRVDAEDRLANAAATLADAAMVIAEATRSQVEVARIQAQATRDHLAALDKVLDILCNKNK